jgi:hypothetical protein
MNKLLLIQPGGFGDLFICAPIAWHYHNEYEIVWPIRKKFFSTATRFGYVMPVCLPEEELRHSDWLRSDVSQIYEMYEPKDFDLVLDLADRGTHPTTLPTENFEQAKYRLSEVPYQNKHFLRWERNFQKENELFELVVGDIKDYVFTHLVSSLGDRGTLPDVEKRPVIECRQIDGFEIQDWYKVIDNAKAIYCIESSVHCFIDGIMHRLEMPKYLLRRPGQPMWTISELWDRSYL